MTAWDELGVLFNLVIVAGYLAVPATALRLIPMRPFVRAAGVIFFLTCATTHVFMALVPLNEHHHSTAGGGSLLWVMLVNHAVQSIAVWVFVLGLAEAVRDALARRRAVGARNPDRLENHDDGHADAQQRK